MNPRVVLRQASGTLMVTSDVHGNLDDLLAFKKIFEGLTDSGEDVVWVSLGDWVHGPAGRGTTMSWAGEELFRYPDRTVEVIRIVQKLFQDHPGRFMSLLGNHEHSHISGRLTCRFHRNEAAHLESQLPPDEVAAMLAMFRSWPVIVQVPSCGVVLSHGAPSDEWLGTRVIDEVLYEGEAPPDSARFLEDALWNYTFSQRGGRRFLDHLSIGLERYDLVIHGHDRDLDGGSPDSEWGFLLCSSFGARRACKAYLLLDLSHRYQGSHDLREGIEIRRLYPDR